MLKKYINYKKEGINHITVKLINGACTLVQVKSIVGYCCYSYHRGYLTSNLLKEHKCCEKNCKLLRKFKDYPYWKNKENESENKKNRKTFLKANKVLSAMQKAKKDLYFETIKKTAQELADKYGCPILFTRIAEISNESYKIFYVSDYDYDVLNPYRKTPYREISQILSYKYGCNFTLKHIKMPDGSCATLSDWQNRKK